MKRKLIKSIITVQIIMYIFAFNCMAFNDLEAGAYLWKLINEARSRPIEAIKAYRIDYERAKLALGDDSWILESANSLPPLAWNISLEESSTAHSSDMINRQYYSYTSPEGLSFNDRIIKSGYNPISTGESLGILSFYLYIDPVKAVETIFENMLRDELNPELGYPKNIFSKDFTEIGISFISTILAFGKDSNGRDIVVNAYVVTADFARPVELKTYIMGNIYNIGENQPDNLVWQDKYNFENSYAENLLRYKQWSPEKANDHFVMWVNNITEGTAIQVLNRPLGSYQIEIPLNTFYFMEIYRKIDDSAVQGELLKRIINIGLDVNQMADFGIN